MKAIKIHETSTNVTKHRAVVDGVAMREIIGAHVAQLAGVDATAPNVSFNVQLSSRMGNYNTIEEAIVLITIDHDALPVAVDAIPE